MLEETVVRTSAAPSGSQWRLVLVILLPVLLLLSLAYMIFLRQPMVPLASDLRPDEAANVVEALKKEDVAFALGDGGRTVEVPADRVDELRVSLASSDLARKGGVGFELFNESDMGLTDFAQKVNYQRALQGEIARTILEMQGIAAARVHLALPERQLFRAERETAKAAVMVTPRPGVVIDAGRVAGIQELVAAAVPGLPVDQVAVLDGGGQLIGPALASDGVIGSDSGSALERSYADKGANALRTVLGGRNFELRVKVVPRIRPAPAPGERDHSILAVLFTSQPLSREEQRLSASAIRAVLALDRNLGDDLLFSQTPAVAPAATGTSTNVPPASLAEPVRDPLPAWTWAVVAGAALLSMILLAGFWRSQRRRRLLLLAERVRGELLLERVPA